VAALEGCGAAWAREAVTTPETTRQARLGRVFGDTTGLHATHLIDLGTRLGLFECLARASGGVTPDALAARAGKDSASPAGTVRSGSPGLSGRGRGARTSCIHRAGANLPAPNLGPHPIRPHRLRRRFSLRRASRLARKTPVGARAGRP
jgi:hypothetical protein